MAIYHCSAKIISHSTGRTSVAAAAYRSGEKLKNEIDGITHDYTGKTGVVFSEISIPENAPQWCENREQLWNEVEKIEKGKRAQVAREIEIALPVELNKEQQIEVCREYVKTFTQAGMVSDLSIHDKKDGNPHAHIMLTVRPFAADGSWGAKAKKEYILDRKGEKIKLKSGEWKSRKIATTNWNEKETLLLWRQEWERIANVALERAGRYERIHCQTLEAQGIERMPTIHEGATARAIEKKNGSSLRGRMNKRIREMNEKIRQIGREIMHLSIERITVNKKDSLERIRMAREEAKLDNVTEPSAEPNKRYKRNLTVETPRDRLEREAQEEMTALSPKERLQREMQKKREQSRGLER